MDSSDSSKPGPKSKTRRKAQRSGEAAFDLWLQRGLHQLYDDVAAEPVPEDLLRLIEDDRSRGSK